MRFSEFKSRWKRVSTLSLCALARSVREVIIRWSDQNKQTKAVPIYVSELFSILFNNHRCDWTHLAMMVQIRNIQELSLWNVLIVRVSRIAANYRDEFSWKKIIFISHELTTSLAMITCGCHKYGTRKLCSLNESTRFSNSKDANRVNTNFILEKCQVGPSTTIYYFHNKLRANKKGERELHFLG